MRCLANAHQSLPWNPLNLSQQALFPSSLLPVCPGPLLPGGPPTQPDETEERRAGQKCPAAARRSPPGPSRAGVSCGRRAERKGSSSRCLHWRSWEGAPAAISPLSQLQHGAHAASHLQSPLPGHLAQQQAALTAEPGHHPAGSRGGGGAESSGLWTSLGLGVAALLMVLN